MKTAEDFYMLWIESDEATKYRNSPKYRYSEMIAFAEAYAEHQKLAVCDCSMEGSRHRKDYSGKHCPICGKIVEVDKD